MARSRPDDPAALALGNVATAPATPTDRAVLYDATIAPDTEFGGRYQIHRLLGRGGMGAVYEATDTNLRRQVALKVVLPSTDGGSEGTARMLREARAMAALHHPNVIVIYDVGVHDGQVFLAMQLVAGTTMRAWLAEKRSMHAILNMLHRAGRGLAAAHAAGLVHRDFKPDNVLVSATGTPLVTDFGLARGVGERASLPVIPKTTLPPIVGVKTLTRTGAIIGTPAYMPPEQARGEDCDARADQFSFCVSAWEALYGQRPFEGSTWDEIYECIVKQQVAEPASSQVNRTVRSALLRGLAPEPADRFASLDELLAVLDRAIAAPRKRRLGVLLATCAVAAIAGTAIVMKLGQSSDDRDPALAGPPTASISPGSGAANPAVSPAPANVAAREVDVGSAAPDAGTPEVAPRAATPARPVATTARSTAPSAPATGSAAVAPAAAAPATTVAPPPATPDPEIVAAKLEVLRQRRSGLDGRRKNRSLLLTDLPALPKQIAAVDAALAARDVAAATAALDTAEATIDNVKIDGPFVSAKHTRLNAQLQAQHLPAERYQAIMEMFTAELRAYQSHRYDDANVLLNQIAKALVADQ